MKERDNSNLPPSLERRGKITYILIVIVIVIMVFMMFVVFVVLVFEVSVRSIPLLARSAVRSGRRRTIARSPIIRGV